MHGLNLASLLIAVFIAGAYAALFVRALIGESSDRRVNDAAMAALSPEALAHLREHLAVIDGHVRAPVKDGRVWGSVQKPPPPAAPTTLPPSTRR